MPGLEARIAASIASRGWHVVAVPGDAEGPGFAYSIGLHRSFGHPEVIVFGLPIPVLQAVVDVIGDRVRRGARFNDGDLSEDILTGLPVRFRAVSRSHLDAYLGQAVRHHGGREFPVLQVFWPDRRGRFPGEPGAPADGAGSQPSLQGEPPEGQPA